MRKLLYALPLIVLVVLSLFFARGLQMDPKTLPSELIDKPVPAFALDPIPGRDKGAGLTSEALTGAVSLVNIWGSWCIACKAEHPMLNHIQASYDVPLHGIDWKDEPGKALAWLRRNGDPYDRVGMDPDSTVAIDFGVTGAPETFVVDAEGVIRYKHTGPITRQAWENTIWPLIQHLRDRTKEGS